jgi:hypothetical protein
MEEKKSGISQSYPSCRRKEICTARKENCVAAVITCFNVYDNLGINGFDQTIRILHDAWKGNYESLSAQMISGIGHFVKTYGKDFNESVLIKALSGCDPEKIRREAIRKSMSLHNADNTTIQVSKLMWEFYNKRTKKKLPYLFIEKCCAIGMTGMYTNNIIYWKNLD